MDRAILAVAALAAIAGSFGCSPAFKDKRTPSGDFCSDMPIVPAGQEPDREYHRLQPIQSDPKARTEAERLESLRKAACKIDADAVIEAVNEEVRGENAQYGMVSSGTAVIWLHHTDTSRPPPATLVVATPKKPAAVATPAPTDPAPPPSETPASAPDPAPKPSAAKPKSGPKPIRPLGAPPQ